MQAQLHQQFKIMQPIKNLKRNYILTTIFFFFEFDKREINKVSNSNSVDGKY